MARFQVFTLPTAFESSTSLWKRSPRHSQPVADICFEGFRGKCSFGEWEQARRSGVIYRVPCAQRRGYCEATQEEQIQGSRHDHRIDSEFRARFHRLSTDSVRIFSTDAMIIDLVGAARAHCKDRRASRSKHHSLNRVNP